MSFINSLWPCGAIWRLRRGAALAQVMDCCLTAPRHCLNQRWLRISQGHRRAISHPVPRLLFGILGLKLCWQWQWRDTSPRPQALSSLLTFHWFCKCTPPWMFLPLDIPSEYRPEHVTFGLLCVIFKFPSRIFCRRVPGFATDCPCGVWCRGLTTCLLYVGPPLEF